MVSVFLHTRNKISKKCIFRALFGYEGQTNDLKVVSTGSDGLEEMIEEFSSGKIMYAFVKIKDTKTSLDKCVLINWQGEGANTVRKGMCANHLRDLESFFSAAHLTINARNEDEVEPSLIMDKVAKASSSSYNFHPPKPHTEKIEPVGTSYQRVNPAKEIISVERDEFWKKEKEEQTRLEEERKLLQMKKQEEIKLINTSIKLEKEKQQQEEKVVKKTPEKPIRASLAKQHIQIDDINENKLTEESDDDSCQFSTIKRSPKDLDKKTVSPLQENNTNHDKGIEQMTEQQIIDEYSYMYGFTADLKARALYDYQAGSFNDFLIVLKMFWV